MTTLSAAVVDSDAAASRDLERLLVARGYRVFVHRTLGQFLDKLSRKRPDLAMIDMSLPGIAGREILRALRCDPANRRMILIALTSTPSRDEAVAAFDAGADEYFGKPVGPELLSARLQSLLRRASAPPEEPCFRHSGITVHPSSRRCLVDAKPVRLTRLEFDILLMFIQNPQRVLTRGILIDSLWNGAGSRGSRAVDRHVSALRAKLGDSGRRLRTLVGIGYCLGDGLNGSSK